MVFGAGPANAGVMLIGEVPGDQEDRAGEPFVGPAGRLLDDAVGEAGLDRDRIYVTNAVKHFKYKLRGKRRIHQTPSKLEVEACRPWLDAELTRVRPHTVGLLGATAAKALLGSGFKVSERRGEVLEVDFAPRGGGHVPPVVGVARTAGAARRGLRRAGRRPAGAWLEQRSCLARAARLGLGMRRRRLLDPVGIGIGRRRDGASGSFGGCGMCGSSSRSRSGVVSGSSALICGSSVGDGLACTSPMGQPRNSRSAAVNSSGASSAW